MRKKIKLSLFAIISGFIIENSSVQASELNNPYSNKNKYRNWLNYSGGTTSRPVTQSWQSLNSTQTTYNTPRSSTVDNRNYHPDYPLQQEKYRDNDLIIQTFQANALMAGAYLDYADSRLKRADAKETFELSQSGKYIGAVSIIPGKPGTNDTARLPEVSHCFIGTEDPKQLLALTDTSTRNLDSREGFNYAFKLPTVLNNIKPFTSYFDDYSDYNKSIQALVGEWGANNVRISNIGHSVGGPRALLSLMYTRHNFGIDKTQQVFTFGATPLLNSGAAKQIDDLDLSITNVYNIQDTIWKTPRSFSKTYVNMPGYVFYLYDNGQTGILAHQWKTGYFNNLASNVKQGKLHLGSSFHKKPFANTNPEIPGEMKLLVGLGKLLFS
jgi:hypothetical protein